jgi:acyl-CoA thioesterase
MQPSTPIHPLDRATTLTRTDDGAFTGQTDPAYANMVGPFGGVTAAAMLNAILLHPDRLGEPVAFTVNFAAPVADGPYRIVADPVRTNRSTQHWTVTLRQDDGVKATATAVFALRRETWSATESRMPEVPPAQDVPPSRLADTQRAWFDQYETRFIKGTVLNTAVPASERDSVTTLWVRDEPPRPLDIVALTALCDSFAPRVMVRRAEWVPIGTVSVTMYFHADPADLAAQGSRPLLGTARASRFGRGYHDQVAELWSDSGTLLATSHQVVYFKA